MVTCTILDGSMDYVVQAALAVISFGVLILKWWLEFPRRRAIVFLLDASKQCGGFLIAHFGNLLLSELLRTDSKDACVWYFINIVVDTTLRVAIAYGLLRLVEFTLEKTHLDPWGHLQSGHYSVLGGPIVYMWWFQQLLLWLLIVTVSRVITGVLLVVCSTPAGDAGAWLLAPLENYSKEHGHALELWMVMIVTPLILNTMQLWVQDNFLSSGSKVQRMWKKCCPCIMGTDDGFSQRHQLDEYIMEDWSPSALQETPNSRTQLVPKI
eukprot:TRINITY_DN5540_c0_g1_i1.p1 TRINITY_DN5540_c0_g1~~TRINITY_DN5540_c0_g1_i1.p1  ORF type:complete len:285 (-),score=69.14 TRINITY_DN5540_c0_g1_i1:32-832(-)